MREHPIPQDITGYQFHIIGNMTIKQFAEVGLGVFLAFLVYTTNLPGPIKWPIMTVLAGLGALAAFVPIAERPLDHWIVIFFNALFKPTKFYWKRHANIPEALLYEPRDVGPILPEVDLSPVRRQRVKEYMTSLHASEEADVFDAYFDNRIDEIVTTFHQVTTSSVDVVKKQEKPELQVRVRTLTGVQSQEPDVVEAQKATPVFTKTEQAAERAAQSVLVPAQEVVEVSQTQLDQKTAQELSAVATTHQQAYVESAPTPSSVQADEAAQFNINLPFPTPPSEPNKPVGMVLDPNNNLITNAIVEVLNETGVVVRAVKSNSLGQFFITTPLSDGSYTVVAEKEGYAFPSLQLQLEGDVVAPLEIRGTPAT